MIKNQNIYLGVFIVLIFLIVGPIIINMLMFKQNLVEVKGTADVWVTSLSTYFGAIIGGVISGLLTLFGVKLTIDQQTKLLEKQEERYAEDKYNGAQYIKAEVFHLITNVQVTIKSFNHHNYNENLTSVSNAAVELNEITKKMYPQASNISATLLNALKNVSWAALDIKEFIEEAGEQDFPQDYVVNELMNGRYYNRLAISDELFYSTIESFKLKK